ncbi:MAG TPA: hypothetical protein VGX92_18590 [Pyrinomonadaceae bacterium]|nr:hypothetical protein [Pyrinomonadaceae bacterium]
MPPPKQTRRLVLFALSVCCSMLFVAPARAQYKIDLQTCEDLKITETQYGASVVETATCINPIKTFQPKGTLRNVNIVATFPAVPTGAGVTFMVTKTDADGEYVQNVDYAVSPRHTTAYARLTINTPGKYFVRMVNYYDKSQVWGSADFAVGEDTVGPRAAGNTAAGQGKVSICKEIDDDWKCVGQSNQWVADSPFNVLFENPAPVGVDFIGIIFYKQGAGGKDVEFINEYQQNMGETNRKYATVGNEIKLPAGTYSVYIIAWGKREVMEHRGNLTEYFAKTVLTVK